MKNILNPSELPTEGVEYDLTIQSAPGLNRTYRAIYKGVKFEDVVKGYEGKMVLNFELTDFKVTDQPSGKVHTLDLPSDAMEKGVHLAVWPEDFVGVKVVEA